MNQDLARRTERDQVLVLGRMRHAVAPGAAPSEEPVQLRVRMQSRVGELRLPWLADEDAISMAEEARHRGPLVERLDQVQVRGHRGAAHRRRVGLRESRLVQHTGPSEGARHGA